VISTDAATKIEYGDYQTPEIFARKVCEKIYDKYKLSPSAILEPTFGIGNFFSGLISTFPKTSQIFGIEINKNYYNIAKQTITKLSSNDTLISLFNDNIFNFDFNKIKILLSSEKPILIIGNPPWVTNSQLSLLNSNNIPIKTNQKNFSGLDAITGKSNFDIGEYIITNLLQEFSNFNCYLAMLCKTIVAKNIIRDLNKLNLSLNIADLFIFNATNIFNVNCDAGLFVVQIGNKHKKTCTIYDFATNKEIRTFGWVSDTFYSNINSQGKSIFDGKCQLEWRQGIKHDCAKVMEFISSDEVFFQNKLAETNHFTLGRYIYPLVKSSDIKSYLITKTRKYVLVPQSRVNEETSTIKYIEPNVWEYLQIHDEYFKARRSSIYKNSPNYSIFGIGEYSFSKIKVGISGFYKEPLFSIIIGEHPIMLDDTCYFLNFDKLSDALITLSLLNSKECIFFLKSITFLNSKRPFTKEILQRIDLYKLSKVVNFEVVNNFLLSNLHSYTVSEADFTNFCESLKPKISTRLF
jgi:16S rRNA A1518/A1519 N6-dimethyltransferase RsmA/KsgA/DIM1 with predicted DNA glycosylase/AP lyase activity